MFDRGQEGLRSNHLYKKQMCRGELVLIQARQIGFTWIKSSQTQDKLKKNRKIQTLPSSLLPFIKIYDGPSRYLFSGHAITWSTVCLRSCLHSWGCGLNEVPWRFDSGDFGPYWHGILTCCRSEAAHPWCQSPSSGNRKVLHWGETS